jgi:hypothetical protein
MRGSFSGVSLNLNATDNVRVEVLATPAFSLRKLDEVRGTCFCCSGAALASLSCARTSCQGMCDNARVMIYTRWVV